MNDDIIRIGIVGAGANTKDRHIPRLRSIEGVEIVSVCNRSQESSERVAQGFGISNIYDTWEDLVAAPESDAIVIGTWPYLHCPVTLTALDANKHVLCEARMAMNAREAHRMLESSKAKPHLVSQIVPSPLTLRVDDKIKQLLADGFLGNLLAIEVRSGGTFLDPESPLHWRQDSSLSGLNVMTLGIWYEPILRWVGGATKVMAMGKTFVRERSDDKGIMQSVQIPEHLDVIADMDYGVQAHIQISNVTGFAGTPEVFLFGTKGTLYYTEDRLYGGRQGKTRLEEIVISSEDEGQWRVEEEFIGAIRGQEEITCTTFEEGVEYMEFTEAVSRSMTTGKAISLPL